MNSIPNEITTEITGFLNQDKDSHWRYYLTINITNNGQNNITLSNIQTEILNVTYANGSFEEWNIKGNLTVNKVLGSHSSILFNWTVTDYGFLQEPKIVWVKLDVFLLGLENPFTSTFAIPELSPFFILPSVMLLTLLTVFIKRFSVNKKSKRFSLSTL